MDPAPPEARPAATPRPWDARLANRLVRPLVGTRVRPNHLTTLRLVVGVAGAALFALGGGWVHLGAGLFALSVFADHADGELARLTGQGSRLGHVYDVVSDLAVMVLTYAGMGVGLRDSSLHDWAPRMGIVAGLAVASIFWMWAEVENRRGKEVAALPRVVGFELEDVTYLFAPVVWLGGLLPLLVVSAVGAPVFAVWFLRRTLRRLALPQGGSPADRAGGARVP